MMMVLALAGAAIASALLYLAAIGLSVLWKIHLLMLHRGLIEEHRSLYAEGVTLTQQTRLYERLAAELQDPSFRTKLYDTGSEAPPPL